MSLFQSIPEYPKYAITDNGRVWSFKLKRFMKERVSKLGYNRIALYNENGIKETFVHRIVAKAFISNENGKPFINHIDGNKLNNYASNLEWCTQSENRYHALKVLGVKTVAGRRQSEEHKEKNRQKTLKYRNIVNIDTGEMFPTIKDMAESYGYTYNAVLYTVLNRKNKIRGLNLRVEGRI